jgi:hypothetical protein
MSQFVQKLRVYAQKFGLPSVSSTISQQSPASPITRRIGLPVADLLKWDGWNAKAREYLASVGDTIDIRVVVESYELRVREFYTWFVEHYRNMYAPDLHELNQREWELLLLELRASLRIHPLVRAQTTINPRRDEVFVQVFGSKEFAELESVSDGPKRGERAIALLRRMGDVPEDLTNTIEVLYAESDATTSAQQREAHSQPTRSFRGETIRLTELLEDSAGDVLDDLLAEDCEVVGPIVVVPIDTEFEDCTWDVIGSNPKDMFWETPAKKTAIIGAVGLRRCRFVRCNFSRVGIAGRPDYLAGWQQTPRAK